MDDQGFYTPEHRAAFVQAQVDIAEQDRIFASGTEAEQLRLAREILSLFRIVRDTAGRKHLYIRSRVGVLGMSRIVAPPGCGETVEITTGPGDGLPGDYCTLYLENETPRLAPIVEALGFQRFAVRAVINQATATREDNVGLWFQIEGGERNRPVIGSISQHPGVFQRELPRFFAGWLQDERGNVLKAVVITAEEDRPITVTRGPGV